MKLHRRAPILHCSNQQVVHQSLPVFDKRFVSDDSIICISTYLTWVGINSPSTQSSSSDWCRVKFACFVTNEGHWGLWIKYDIRRTKQSKIDCRLTFCRSCDFPYCRMPWNFIPHPVAMTCWPSCGVTVGQQIELIFGELARSTPCFSLSSATSLSR